MSDFFRKVDDHITREEYERTARFAEVRESSLRLFQHYQAAKQIISEECRNLQFYDFKSRKHFSLFEKLFYGDSRRIPSYHQLQEEGSFEQIVATGWGELHLTLVSAGRHGHLSLHAYTVGHQKLPSWLLKPMGRTPEETAQLFFAPVIKYGREHGSCEPRKI